MKASTSNTVSMDNCGGARAGCWIGLAARCFSLILLSAVAISWPNVRAAVAQEINVPPVPPSSPNGTIWNLTGPVSITGSVQTPSGSRGLTINGNGETITLSNGAFVLPMNAAPILTLQNVTITGGNNASAISGSNLQGVDIPITGAVTFSNINAPQNGSVLGVTTNGTVAVGSSGSIVSFENNTAPTGGAISVQNASFALSGDATFSGNMATSGNGGAINDTGGQSVVIGDSSASTINFTGNTAAKGRRDLRPKRFGNHKW